MNCRQLKEVVIVPVLSAFGLNTPEAVNMMLGTAAQESQMGKFILQEGMGYRGGIGIYQMQASDYQSIWERIITPSQSCTSKFRMFLGYEGKPPPERMASDLWLATAMTRLHYYAISSAIPSDLPGMAHYWKKYYNTMDGKGTEQEFIDNYNAHINNAP